MSVHACGLTLCTGAPLFKVSPWALRLWQRNETRFLPRKIPLSLLFHTPPNHKKYYQSVPGEKQRGNVIWKRGANPPQQQLFPNHNNLGKGCGLYFMGGEGPWMFIYLSPQSALRGVCVFVCVIVCCMCVCVRDEICHSTLFSYTGKSLRSLVILQSAETSERRSQTCAPVMNM